MFRRLVVSAACFALLTFFTPSTRAQSATPVATPTAHAPIALTPPVPVRFESGAEGGVLVLGRGRSEVRLPLPLGTPTTSTRVVRLAGRAVGIVELEEGTRRFAVVVDGRGPTVRWSGRLDPHGDPGERRRDVLRVEDLTGDGVDDLVVGTVEEARSICGRETLLDARAIDPRTGALRPVTLRALDEIANEPEVGASSVRPEAVTSEQPLVRALIPRATTSTAGVPTSVAPPPTALSDRDDTTAWLEGHPGNGRWEAATFAWAATGLRAHHLALVPAAPPALTPAAVWIVHDGGRVRVVAPADGADGGTWWVTLPEPLQTRCLSIVLDAPSGEPASGHSGFAELRAYTDVEVGGGLDALFARLAEGGREGAEAARVLTAIGAPALDAVAARWLDMPSAERRGLLPLVSRFAEREDMAALLASAARSEDEALREAALAACEDRPAGHRVLATLVDDPNVGDAAAVRLSRVAPSELGVLLAALETPEGPSRPALREAIRTSAQRHDASAALDRWSLSEPRVGARAAAVLALAEGGERTREVAARALEPLTALGELEEFEDRWRVARAARGLPQDASAPWVDRFLEADEWMLRAEALDVVARWAASEETRARVRPRLEDAYPRVRAAAARALTRLTPSDRDVEAVAVIARRDKWPLVRAAAIEALVGIPRALPILRVGVDDPARRVRAAAIEGLSTSGDEAAWPRVEARMTDDDEWPEVIAAGIRFAQGRCSTDAVPALAAVIERARRPEAWAPDVDLAVVAIDALVAIGGPEAEAALTRAGEELAPPPLRAAVASRERVTRCTR